MHLTAGQKKLKAEKKHHRAKSSKSGSRKHRRNERKCERYRVLVGKPNGPGQPGNKAGKNKR